MYICRHRKNSLKQILLLAHIELPTRTSRLTVLPAYVEISYSGWPCSFQPFYCVTITFSVARVSFLACVPSMSSAVSPSEVYGLVHEFLGLNGFTRSQKEFDKESSYVSSPFHLRLRVKKESASKATGSSTLLDMYKAWKYVVSLVLFDRCTFVFSFVCSRNVTKIGEQHTIQQL
jgi:hypothetical protein